MRIFFERVFVNLQIDMNEENSALNKSSFEERQRGFEGLISFAGTLPEDFDYKKEPGEARNEKILLRQ